MVAGLLIDFPIEFLLPRGVGQAGQEGWESKPTQGAPPLVREKGSVSFVSVFLALSLAFSLSLPSLSLSHSFGNRGQLQKRRPQSAADGLPVRYLFPLLQVPRLAGGELPTATSFPQPPPRRASRFPAARSPVSVFHAVTRPAASNSAKTMNRRFLYRAACLLSPVLLALGSEQNVLSRSTSGNVWPTLMGRPALIIGHRGKRKKPKKSYYGAKSFREWGVAAVSTVPDTAQTACPSRTTTFALSASNRDWQADRRVRPGLISAFAHRKRTLRFNDTAGSGGWMTFEDDWCIFDFTLAELQTLKVKVVARRTIFANSARLERNADLLVFVPVAGQSSWEDVDAASCKLQTVSEGIALLV
ncbi:MAG: hypothetical protein BJ554DRAFT_4221 [Olpidium bornovanus]|uniref:Uncharacterized protein n=1 Tax=Olpidium bornovanus TaxID=278681 RepID=A0A8H8DFN7_9FUNG|nr:MAG: hypothetical protein BJ554DRAFT_4221 [Olpidium bornovanus]